MNLAELGEDPVVNLRRCIRKTQVAAKHFVQKTDRAAALMNEGAARLALAEIGFRPQHHLRVALRKLKRARRLQDHNSMDHARTQINEGTVRVRLAELGIQPVDNLDRAIGLFRRGARRWTT